MGFFMDGEDAQMPIVIGVLRVKKAENPEKHTFVFTGKEIDSPVVNPAIEGHPILIVMRILISNSRRKYTGCSIRK